MYSVRWQLEYAGGLLRTEPPEGETILHAPKHGIVALRLVDHQNNPIQRIEIRPGWRPIFYRVKSLSMNPNHGIQLDGTIFGMGDPNAPEVSVAVTLWRWNSRRQVAENAALADFDPTMVEMQLA